VGTKADSLLQKLELNVPGLNGTVYLERGQYLHLGMRGYAIAHRRRFGEPRTAFALNENPGCGSMSRNYYDHPAFGVIGWSPAQVRAADAGDALARPRSIKKAALFCGGAQPGSPIEWCLTSEKMPQAVSANQRINEVSGLGLEILFSLTSSTLPFGL